jgi:precorrin-6A/cobalt-precorrin-6A reductase
MTLKHKVWLIGGTSNATEICERLIATGVSVIVTVTTDFGRQLSELPGIWVIKAMLSIQDMEQLILENNIDLIIDASHPFATEVSANAMLAAKNTGVPYLRFERGNTRFGNATYVDSYEESVAFLTHKPGNILLTTGSKFVAKFIPLGVERLFARVLSTSESVALCEQAGLKSVNVIAMCGVGSVALNMALLKEFDIRFLVTKESGVEGGLQEKIEAANQVNAEVIIIQRPAINYPEVYSDYDLLMDRIKTI